MYWWCLCAGELQSILCAAFSATGEAYTGTLSGDVYKWKGHHLHSVVKTAHKVNWSFCVCLVFVHSCNDIVKCVPSLYITVVCRKAGDSLCTF